MLVLGWIGVSVYARRVRWSDLDLAREVEARHPEMDSVLLTAVEISDDRRKEGFVEPGFLQKLVLAQAAGLYPGLPLKLLVGGRRQHDLGSVSGRHQPGTA